MKCLLLLFAAAALAQETAPTVEMTPAEKQFQESMTNVTMTGFFTVGDAAETRPDSYVIERITKVQDDLWKFEARIQYNKKDFKAAIKVPVKWAGETPVLTLAN